MKKITVITIFILTAMYGKAQTVLGTAYMKCYYEYKSIRDTANFTWDTCNPKYLGSVDHMRLLIGKNVSKFYSYDTFLSDSISNAYLSGKMSQNEYYKLRTVYRRGETFKIYTNYPKGRLTFTDLLVMTYFLYEEGIPKQEWKISGDTSTISGYKCQKATCVYRGRQYVAWFTDAIQINNGPFKFWGLPGLIVEVRDSKYHHLFRLAGIEKTNEPIIFDKKDYINTNRKDYTGVFRKYRYNNAEFMMSMYGGESVFAYDKNGNKVELPVWNTDIIEKDIK
ncbi:MAG: GLPGLI family protein [Prevotellaceae bacterium]|jgi:GLPGLI family protein|nr:GLPGLI family protein [Prevotellaceae bacterium]